MTAIRAAVSEQLSGLSAFVEAMQESLPFPGIKWAEPMWDLTHTRPRAGRRRHLRAREVLWFVRHRAARTEEASPFEDPFGSFAKAVICARHLRGAQTCGTHRVSVRALRYLYDALCERNSSDPARLDARDFLIAESVARSREMPSSAYRLAQRLEEIAVLVNRYRVTPIDVTYRSSVPRCTGGPLNAKMPSADVLEELAGISSSISARGSVEDLILMRVVDLFVASGLRAGEVLTLRANPIVRDSEGLGLRYWPEKGAETRVKRFAAVQSQLVERAVRDLSKACKRARALATRFEKDSCFDPLPPKTPELLSGGDVEALGLAGPRSGLSWLKTHRVPTFARGRSRVSKRSEVIAALHAMRDAHPLVAARNGRTQSLGESLIVVFRNQLHESRSTNRFVPTSLSLGTVADYLGARDDTGTTTSVFTKFGEASADGRRLRITTHQFRHWLHTLAARGGLTEVELARWMGRNRIADNRAYDHRTQEERAEEARALIRKGSAAGPIADTYRSLPPVDADAFLQAQVNAVLTTPYGLCVHDYGQGPCERHFSCAGCSELIRTKGEIREHEAAKLALSRTRQALSSARIEENAGSFGASNWVKHHQRLELDLIELLAVDDDPSVPLGSKVRPHPRGHKGALS